ncbi:MAG: substrate-binding domain-containing protein [Sphaerochaeta sp.]|nr:substrate-binding domain-containing protein [Sphaerochaeta sp.]
MQQQGADKYMQETKRCIGVFTASLDDGYQSTIWHAIEQSAREHGFGSISFLGSRLGSPIASEASSNLAYHLANVGNIDGLIIIASSLATFFTSVDLKEFFAPWADLPRVSIGMRIPGMSDVVVEGTNGISGLMEHLIDEHGRRHFALVCGPGSHDEAISRLEACREILKRREIPLDERMVIPGSFTQESGTHAVRSLCASNIPFDALVCLNDRMAQGALEELSKRGIRVPDDVSVIGFDGIESSRYSLPPLTTVVQPMHELGVAAVDMLERLMRGGSEEHITLSCSPLVRESCGCGPRFNYTPNFHEIPRYASSSEHQAMFDLMILIRKGDYNGLIKRLNRAIDTTGTENGAVDRWNEYLSIVEHHCENTPLAGDMSLSTLMGAARVFTNEKIGRYQAAKRIAAETSFETLRQVSAMLAGAFELADMFSNLKKGLQLFGLDRGYLVVFNRKKGKARLLMSVEDGRQSTSSFSQEFDYAQLLPSQIGPVWRQGQWILMPLVYNDEPLGYLIVPIGIVLPALYDVLQEQISSNLKGTLLLEQIRSHERTLAEQVELRTEDLIRTNRELSSEIKRRTELEHEVMEISSKTMERIGQDLHDDLCQHLLGISLLASSVKKTVVDHHQVQPETLERISSLLTESIGKIKTISRGLLPLEMDSHTFAQRLEALVGDAKRYAHVDISVQVDPVFEIADTDRALHIFRIIQEALTNAIRHSHAQHIVIALQTTMESDGTIQRIASIADDGVGLPEQMHKRGLGLRIMRNRASMAKAELSIDSSSGGTVVRIRVPGSNDEKSN